MERQQIYLSFLAPSILALSIGIEAGMGVPTDPRFSLGVLQVLAVVASLSLVAGATPSASWRYLLASRPDPAVLRCLRQTLVSAVCLVTLAVGTISLVWALRADPLEPHELAIGLLYLVTLTAIHEPLRARGVPRAKRAVLLLTFLLLGVLGPESGAVGRILQTTVWSESRPLMFDFLALPVPMLFFLALSPWRDLPRQT